MPSIVNFGGRQIIEPGAYSDIKGQVPLVPITGTYGNVVLIDTGIGAGYGGGGGIAGQYSKDNNAIYSFSNYRDFKNFVRGGVLWSLIEYLFSPSNSGLGARTVYLIRAATTTAPAFSFAFGTGKGAVTIAALNEGVGSNGVLNTGNYLVNGYGVKLVAGVYNPNAVSIELYEGQYRGLDEDGIPYDGIYSEKITKNNLICKSDEFTTCDQFIAWANTNIPFKKYFKITASTSSSSVIATSILASYVGMQLFTGGTTVYDSARVDDILETIADLDNSMFLCLDYGVTPASPTSQQLQDGVNKGAMSSENQKILAHMLLTAEYTNKCMYVGGGQDSTEWKNGTDGSLDVAAYYNSANVVVIHSAVKVPTSLTTNGIGYKFLNSLFHATMWCGAAAGVEPQVNLTYKPIRVIGVKHELKKAEREQSLVGGLGHLKNVANLGWVINQGINTLQNNSSDVLNDGTSPEISIIRIFHQLNKELKIGLTTYFVGGNLASASDVEIKNFVESELQARTATRERDNLIIKFNSVVVTLVDGAWNVTYCFAANGPVNRIFSTGFAVDPNLI